MTASSRKVAQTLLAQKKLAKRRKNEQARHYGPAFTELTNRSARKAAKRHYS